MANKEKSQIEIGNEIFDLKDKYARERLSVLENPIIYTLTGMENSNWVRIAKVKNTANNSSGVFTFDCYGITSSGTKEILTTSVFSVSCGLDSNLNFISDVLPITQAPEVTASDSSSGSGGSGTSSGSGGNANYGLTTITIERYEEEVYVCGLVNFPATTLYSTLEVSLKIENNLNFETLENIEIVNLDEANEEENSLLEGTILEANKDYEFRISCNLEDYISAIESGNNIFILCNGSKYILHYTTDTIAIGNDSLGANYANSSNYPYDLFNYNDVDESTHSKGYIQKGNLELDIFQPTKTIVLNNQGQEMCSSSLVKKSVFITLKSNSNDGEIYINGVQVLSVEHGGEASLEVEINADDKIYATTTSANGAYLIISWYIIRERCTLEFTIPYKSTSDFEINTITIANNDLFNFQLKLAELYTHYVTDSYDLFSVYNRLEKIEETKADLSDVLYTSNALTYSLTNINIGNFYKYIIYLVIKTKDPNNPIIPLDTLYFQINIKGNSLEYYGLNCYFYNATDYGRTANFITISGYNPLAKCNFTLTLKNSVVSGNNIIADWENTLTDGMYEVIENTPEYTFVYDTITSEEDLIKQLIYAIGTTMTYQQIMNVDIKGYKWVNINTCKNSYANSGKYKYTLELSGLYIPGTSNNYYIIIRLKNISTNTEFSYSITYSDFNGTGFLTNTLPETYEDIEYTTTQLGVVANPTLSGDEESLTSVDIDGVNYKIEGGSGSSSETILRLDSLGLDIFALTQGDGYTRDATDEEKTFLNVFMTRINNGEKLSGIYSTYDTLSITFYLKFMSIIQVLLVFNVEMITDGSIEAYSCQYNSESGQLTFVKAQVGSSSTSTELTLVATGTYNSESSLTHNIAYDLDNYLKANKFYYIERYDDNMGAYYSCTFRTYQQGSYTISSKCTSRIDGYNEETDENFLCYMNYESNYNPNDTINNSSRIYIGSPSVDIPIYQSENDVVYVYELPFSLPTS